jgi:hypothetical protein
LQSYCRFKKVGYSYLLGFSSVGRLPLFVNQRHDLAQKAPPVIPVEADRVPWFPAYPYELRIVKQIHHVGIEGGVK